MFGFGTKSKNPDSSPKRSSGGLNMTLSDAFDDVPTSRTLLITVSSDEELYHSGVEMIDRLKRGESVQQPDTFAFPSVDLLFETFNPRTMTLLETITNAEPASIRETARLVDRDSKNVHEELTTLERLGIIHFEADGRSKKPIFPYEEIVITLPFDHDESSDAASVLS